MKNLKVGDKVKSRKTGFYGVVTDVDITPNKLFVKVKLMLNDREVEIPKAFWIMLLQKNGNL